MKRTLLFNSFLFIISICLSQTSQVFTSNGNFTVPSGITSITIEVVGAGGNGAGNGGGGGGGGGYAKGAFAVTSGSVLTVNIGSPGGGSGGGSTSVAGLISATGGANGTTVGNPNVGGGGAGGSGSNGNIVNRTGGNGGGGYWTYFGGGGGGAGGSTSNGGNGGNTIVYTSGNCLTPGGSGGTGGGAPGGNGGKGAGFTDNQCNSADPAAAGANYGGGGGGGNGNSSPAQNGAGGYCKIEYGCTAPNAPVNAGSTTTICSGNNFTLMATGSGTVAWYTTPTGGTAVATGTTYMAPAMSTTTTTTITYYASSETCSTSALRTAFTITVFAEPVFTVTLPGTICPGVGASCICITQPGNFVTWSNGSFGNTTTVVPNSIIFVMGVFITNSLGCTASGTFTAPVEPQPTLSIVPATTLCAGQVITYSVSGANTYTWSNGIQSSSFSVAVSTPTTFTVSGTNASGCSNTAAITQTVIQNPTVSIASKNTACPGETVKLTASGAATYTWTGYNSGTVLTVPLSTTTTFTLVGYNAVGCSSQAIKTVTVNTCENIGELPSSDQFIIYPNPSTEQITVRSGNNLILELYSVSGQLLEKIVLTDENSHVVTINHHLSKGIYFVRETNSGEIQKLVVQ